MFPPKATLLRFFVLCCFCCYPRFFFSLVLVSLSDLSTFKLQPMSSPPFKLTTQDTGQSTLHVYTHACFQSLRVFIYANYVFVGGCTWHRCLDFLHFLPSSLPLNRMSSALICVGSVTPLPVSLALWSLWLIICIACPPFVKARTYGLKHHVSPPCSFDSIGSR